MWQYQNLLYKYFSCTSQFFSCLNRKFRFFFIFMVHTGSALKQNLKLVNPKVNTFI